MVGARMSALRQVPLRGSPGAPGRQRQDHSGPIVAHFWARWSVAAVPNPKIGACHAGSSGDQTISTTHHGAKTSSMDSPPCR